MVKLRKFSSKSRLALKAISLFILSLIVIELVLYASSSLFSRPIEVEAEFKEVSLYLAQNSYRLCLVYEVSNPKSYNVNVIAVVDLSKADLGGQKVTVSDVAGVYDKDNNVRLNYEIKNEYVLQITLKLKRNETRTILILL